jgi:uncharacterized protein YggE
MKLARIAVLAAAGLALAAFAGVFQPTGARSASGADPSSGGITVNGTGSTSVVPDRASFTFGSVSQAGTAAEALRASAESVTRIVAALRRAGVAKADLQTAEVSLEPRLNANGDAVVDYTATNSVTATVRKLAEAGGVVDAAVGAGANQVYGPNLVASDRDASYGTALEAAVADARRKAELLASTAGTTLGRITSIVEAGGTPQPLFAASAAQDSAPAIQPGTQTVEAAVTVTFAVG